MAVYWKVCPTCKAKGGIRKQCMRCDRPACNKCGKCRFCGGSTKQVTALKGMRDRQEQVARSKEKAKTQRLQGSTKKRGSGAEGALVLIGIVGVVLWRGGVFVWNHPWWSAAGIGSLAGLGWLSHRLHQTAVTKYGHSPLNTENLKLMIFPAVTMIAALVFLDDSDSQTLNEAILAGDWTVTILCVLSIGFFGWFLRRAQKRTSWLVSLAGTVILLIAIVLIPASLIAVLALLKSAY